MQALTKAADAARSWVRRGTVIASGPAVAGPLRDIFEWAYGRAVDGMPGIDGAAALADRYAARHADTDAAIAALIAAQSGIAGAAGFLTGCGGFIALPLALPANLASAIYIQARLVAAIARLRGHDLGSSDVRTMALACLAGSKAAGTLRDAGARFGTRVTRDAAGWLSPAILKKVQHAVTSPTACAVGTGASRFAKVAPVVGGVVAGGFDAAVTQLIGRTADRIFKARANSGQQAAEIGHAFAAAETLPDRP